MSKHLLANTQAASSLVFGVYLGKPIAADTDYIHAAITLASAGTTVTTTGITQPDVPRIPTVTGNAGSITCDVTLAGYSGPNSTGTAITDTVAMNGSSTVPFTKAFGTITSITTGARNAPGDTAIIGVGAQLGLGFLPSLAAGLDGWLDGTLESTKPTFAFDATDVSKNYVTLNSAASMANTKAVVVSVYALGAAAL